ncbi:MAG: hypothetical protein OXB95_09035 [Rhodobacteraceae bacterium]|nr:hypothetical protein [Paracoccaceae bacterium]
MKPLKALFTISCNRRATLAEEESAAFAGSLELGRELLVKVAANLGDKAKRNLLGGERRQRCPVDGGVVWSQGAWRVRQSGMPFNRHAR